MGTYKFYPISYLTVPIIIIYLFDKEKAAYFYPIIVASSVVGIIVNILLLTSRSARKLFYSLFPLSITFRSSQTHKYLFYTFVILLKSILLYMWPKNMSWRAIMVSLGTIGFYFLSVHLYNFYYIIADTADTADTAELITPSYIA